MTEDKNKTQESEKSRKSSFTIKSITQKDKKKIVLKYLAIFIVSVVLILVTFSSSVSILNVFPDYVPIPTANDLLKIMIETDGILLGFVGIIFAQLLSSISDQQNVLYQRILEKTVQNASEEKKFLEFLDFRKNGLAFIAVFTFLFLLISIFGAMANIAKNSKLLPTDTFSTFGILFGPLFYTMVGVVFLMLAFIVLPMKPPLEEKN
jgi:hypothetical protein